MEGSEKTRKTRPGGGLDREVEKNYIPVFSNNKYQQHKQWLITGGGEVAHTRFSKFLLELVNMYLPIL